MNEKIFIVSGNHDQYKNWVRNNIDRLYKDNKSLSLSNFVYVSSTDTLRGHSAVHGYYIGTYKDRPDIEQIQQLIQHINNR